jgi:hypothetical protein
MKIDKIQVCGYEAAFRGMRNPMESWHKSDSVRRCGEHTSWGSVTLGANDEQLASRLIRAGADHRKFLRFITIYCDITAPRYFWTELDTYKVGTARNSCSTMHKLGKRELTTEDFQDGYVSSRMLHTLNEIGRLYRSTGSAESSRYWDGKPVDGVGLLRYMKQMLPEGYLQKATYMFSYEVALRMYMARRKHRLAEWSGKGGMCRFIRSLPLMDSFISALEEKESKEDGR